MNIKKVKYFINRKKYQKNTKNSIEKYLQGQNESDLYLKHQLYLESYEAYNYNLDGLYDLIVYHRQRGEFQKGFDLGMKYISKYGYNDIIVFEKTLNYNIYKFQFLDEMFLCAYYIGKYSKAYDFIFEIISSEKDEFSGRESYLSKNFNRIGQNLEFVLDKLEHKNIPNKIEKLENILQSTSLTIGVGIPCIPRDFNVLSMLLESISKQTLVPIKVVISLSNMKEKDEEIFNKITSNYKLNFKIFVSTKKQNASENRNIILDYFHSQNDFEILSFIDSDDKMHSQRLEIISKSFMRYSCDVLLHGYYNIKDEPILDEWFRIRKDVEIKTHLEKNKTIVYFSDGRVHNGHVSINKNVKEKFDEFLNISEDCTFVYDNYLQQNKICHIQLPLTQYLNSQSNNSQIKCISFCFTIYNRMKIVCDDLNVLTLFPKCLKSLLSLKKDDEEWEICVSDFFSNDIENVQTELENIIDKYKNVKFKYIQVKEKFSRGVGLNKSFEISTYDNIFFVDADMLFFDRTVIDVAINHLKWGYVYFPMCSSFKNIFHSEYFCQNYGYGNMAISRKNFLKKPNGWLKKYSWGEEDNEMYNFFKKCSKRDHIESFFHQWHPNPKDVPEHRRMNGKKINNKIKNYICVQPTGGLCNYLRVIFSYYKKAKEENKKLVVIWNITKACNGYFLDYFQPITDMLFDYDNTKYFIDYKGCSVNQHFLPDYSSLKLLPYMSDLLEERQNKLNKNYISIHVRRTDHVTLAKKHKKYTHDNEFYNFIESVSDAYVYMATDDLNTYNKFKEKYNEKLLLNYHDVLHNSYRQTSLKNAIIDLYMCVHSIKFMGSQFSSFSDLIEEIRKNKK